MSPPLKLIAALTAWGSPDFEFTLKRELLECDPACLPLHQALSRGSHVTSGPQAILFKRAALAAHHIEVEVGVIFSSVIAGCSCADDPSPIDELTEYGNLVLHIDTRNADTTVFVANSQDK